MFSPQQEELRALAKEPTLQQVQQFNGELKSLYKTLRSVQELPVSVINFVPSRSRPLYISNDSACHKLWEVYPPILRLKSRSWEWSVGSGKVCVIFGAGALCWAFDMSTGKCKRGQRLKYLVTCECLALRTCRSDHLNGVLSGRNARGSPAQCPPDSSFATRLHKYFESSQAINRFW